MDRTYQALGELNNSDLRANQQVIEDFNDLLRVGSKELATEFRDTLKEESRPLEPLHYITKRQSAPFYLVRNLTLTLCRASIPFIIRSRRSQTP